MGTYTSLFQTKQAKNEPSSPKAEVATSNDRTEKRTENRSVSLPPKRQSRRYSFEFYDDQIIRIKQLKYEAELEGKRVSLSDFARQALDEYLQKHKPSA